MCGIMLYDIVIGMMFGVIIFDFGGEMGGYGHFLWKVCFL